MKDAVFALALLGTVLSWAIWGIGISGEHTKAAARPFLYTALGASVFTVVWAVIYGA